MSERFPCQLIVDPPAAGAWNMAIDQALLERIGAGDSPILRIYRWHRPTVSLGYFQRYADFQARFADSDIDVVRRQSGGGAIVHDQEITYSMVVPEGHPLAQNTQALYDRLHLGLIEWLQGFADLEQQQLRLAQCDQALANASDQKPFLCFKRRAVGDVLLWNRDSHHKIIGSAQRRRKSAVLQHGSIIFETSVAAPEVCGFAQLANLSLNLDDAVDVLKQRLGNLLQHEIQLVGHAAETLANAENIRDSRYENQHWTERR